ncbi:MAG: DUF4339 domain-containing protein [Planctomycetales bacterium]|nr:DUF4339 domain-containing protein [Planctomycetales bacterium]
MGIRFRCPNGHKLHVKSFLAGKRGVCPDCGVKVLIPAESADEFRARSSDKSADGDDVDREAAVPTTPRPRPQAINTASAVASNEPAVGVRSTTDLPATSTNTKRPDPGAGTVFKVSPLPSSSTDSAEASDLLGEAVQAKWFVRPPSGGQYGPADTVLFRTWIIEGRVTADSYIWREGWTDWQPAEDLLKRFENQSISRTMPATNEYGSSEVGDIVGAAPTIVPSIRTATSAPSYRQRKSTRSTAMLVIMLFLTCAVLFATLIYVVRYMN